MTFPCHKICFLSDDKEPSQSTFCLHANDDLQTLASKLLLLLRGALNIPFNPLHFLDQLSSLGLQIRHFLLPKALHNTILLDIVHFGPLLLQQICQPLEGITILVVAL